MTRLTAEWVSKAEADWRAAANLLNVKPPVADPCSFHCQQVVEKYFKALLQEVGAAIPYIHDLDKLLDLLLPYDPGLTKLRRGLDTLTEAAVEYRYPGKRATVRQAQAAFRRAGRVRKVIRNKLGLDPSQP